MKFLITIAIILIGGFALQGQTPDVTTVSSETADGLITYTFQITDINDDLEIDLNENPLLYATLNSRIVDKATDLVIFKVHEVLPVTEEELKNRLQNMYFNSIE